MYNFTLSPEQLVKLNDWIDLQNSKAVDMQRANPPQGVPLDLLESCWEDGFPYSGAIGGNLTYSFTPTSIGVIVNIKHGNTGQDIDLTEYDLW